MTQVILRNGERINCIAPGNMFGHYDHGSRYEYSTEQEKRYGTKPNGKKSFYYCRLHLLIHSSISPGLQDYSHVRREPSNPFYATTYNDYGHFSPTVHTVRKCFYGKPQWFGQEHYVRGMYRNHSLNM